MDMDSTWHNCVVKGETSILISLELNYHCKRTKDKKLIKFVSARLIAHRFNSYRLTLWRLYIYALRTFQQSLIHEKSPDKFPGKFPFFFYLPNAGILKNESRNVTKCINKKCCKGRDMNQIKSERGLQLRVVISYGLLLLTATVSNFFTLH